MKIYIGADHAGFELKEEIKAYLAELNCEVEDAGTHRFDPNDDYPDFIFPVAKKVSENPQDSRGIILGGSGQGEAIAANKVKGIRAAVYYGGSFDIVKFSREHNNTNILSLGARFLKPDEAKEAVRLWLETPFEGERHERRIQKIREFENKICSE